MFSGRLRGGRFLRLLVERFGVLAEEAGSEFPGCPAKGLCRGVRTSVA